MRPKLRPAPVKDDGPLKKSLSGRQDGSLGGPLTPDSQCADRGFLAVFHPEDNGAGDTGHSGHRSALGSTLVVQAFEAIARFGPQSRITRLGIGFHPMFLGDTGLGGDQATTKEARLRDGVVAGPGCLETSVCQQHITTQNARCVPKIGTFSCKAMAGPDDRWSGAVLNPTENQGSACDGAGWESGDSQRSWPRASGIFSRSSSGTASAAHKRQGCTSAAERATAAATPVPAGGLLALLEGFG